MNRFSTCLACGLSFATVGCFWRDEGTGARGSSERLSRRISRITYNNRPGVRLIDYSFIHFCHKQIYRFIRQISHCFFLICQKRVSMGCIMPLRRNVYRAGLGKVVWTGELITDTSLSNTPYKFVDQPFPADSNSRIHNCLNRL